MQPTNKNSLCKIGLKTGKQLQSEGINFGRSVYHPYIFFRAPYYSNPINYDSIKDEIISSYGDIDMRNKIFIRVEPDTTNVYSSEIRVRMSATYFHISDGHEMSKNELSRTHSNFIMKRTDDRYNKLYKKYYNSEILRSKKTLNDYLKIIKHNETINSNVYNLYSSKKVHQSIALYPYNREPINRNSEILVSLPHLTPEYFVLCTDNSGIIINNTNDDYNNMPNLEEINANKKFHRRSRKKPCSTYTPPRCPFHCKVSSIDDSKCVWKKRKDRKKI